MTRDVSRRWRGIVLACVFALSLMVLPGLGEAVTRSTQGGTSKSGIPSKVTGRRKVTKADRLAAAQRTAARRKLSAQGSVGAQAVLDPNKTPDYFTTGNYANSPLPLDAGGSYATTLSAVAPGTGIRKFVDSLPLLGVANNLGQSLTVATPNTAKYPGSDYYVIALVEYTEQMHSDLPATKLRGYEQLDPDNETTVLQPPSYMGPTIVARSNRPVRVKFINKLPTGTGGDLFIPVDTTLMGAGLGPDNVHSYSQNRATLHLHGGVTPWISDGTPHQWTTPANENTPYPKGVSARDVPDMQQTGPGELTFYYTNQQSARLMFYHDHTHGITRLGVYVGEAAPYLVRDTAEDELVSGNLGKPFADRVIKQDVQPHTVPVDEVPLVIQDKTFVPQDNQLAQQDPTWNKAKWGGFGQLWFPHVYMPNQNPGDPYGVNAMGRWDYSPWFWPPIGAPNPPIPNPLAGLPGQNAYNPGTPTPTIVPEAFMDTPVVNGTAYPYLKVGRKAYRFRILNASDDRMLNLQLYYAKSNTPASVDGNGNPTLQTDSGEVPMVEARPSRPATWPATWPKDGRDGGVPSFAAAGPSWIQIGNEGGLLPSPVKIDPQPVDYEYFRRTVRVLNVTSKSLYLGPAERADVIVDFSQVPAGSKLIMYNDAPAPMPAFDSRLDYYTDDGDQTAIGGAPNTLPGYGPNTRTVMQFMVDGTAAPAFDTTALASAVKAAYAATQDKPIVPESAYNAALGTSYTDTIVHGTDTNITFTPSDGTTPVTMDLQEKAVIEGFDFDYGRMNAQLGAVAPGTALPAPPGSAAPWYYDDIPTEIINGTFPGTKIGQLNDGTQIWRIDHQGVDTHVLHFHLFNVQVIERVAIDGEVLPTDPNELGWKETMRVNPLVDTIIALRPIVPTNLPFKLGDSIRPLNPTMPLGATRTTTFIDFGVPITFTFTNTLQNFGWEYVWHCHILGHEENDMMRPIVFQVSPAPPANLTATPAAASISRPSITVRWTNGGIFPPRTNLVLERATNSTFTANKRTVSTISSSATSFVDNVSLTSGVRYYYRVRSENTVAYSAWSNTASAIAPAWLPAPVTNLRLIWRTRTSVRVGWNLPTYGAPRTWMRVQWSGTGSNGPWSQTGLLAPSTSALTIGYLRPNHYYWVRVITYSQSGSYRSSTLRVLTLP